MAATYEVAIDWLYGHTPSEVPGGSNLVGWWRFLDGSGSTLTDETGVNDGTITSASWGVGGRIPGDELICAGSTYADCGTDSSLTPNAITVLMLLRADGTNASTPMIAANWKVDGVTLKGFAIYQAANSYEVKVSVNIGGNIYTATICTLSPGIYTLIGFKVDGSKLYTIVNGAVTDQGAAAGNIVWHPSPPGFGVATDLTGSIGTNFVGRICECLIFNTAISDANLLLINTLTDINYDVRSWSFIRGRTQELQRAEVGTCELHLVDTTGKYVTENTGSPLYGYLLPGKPIRIRGTVSGTTTDLYHGYLDDVIPHPGRPGSYRADLPSVDGFDVLARSDTATGIQSNQTADVLIGDALDDADWASHKRSIDTGIDTYPLVYANKKVKNLINDLAESEFGFFYINHAGYAVYENRHHRLKAPHTTSQWTLDGDVYDSINPTNSLNGVFNEIVFRTNPIHKAVALSDLWTLPEDAAGGTSPELLPGESVTFWAVFADATGEESFADDVVSPVATTDYTANAAIDGSGVDYTANLGVVATVFARKAMIVCTNNGANTLYVTLLKIRGKVYTKSGGVEVKSVNTASQSKYGVRRLNIEVPIYQSTNLLQSVADHIIGTTALPIPGYKVSVPGGNDTTLAQQHTRQISDRVTLQNTEYVVDDEFYIDYLEHKWEVGDVLRSVYILSRADDQMYWVLDTSTLGILTRLAA